ncbi:MAG: DUF2156 domain-containing protein [Acidobacteria bacterium]|nr:DUF2156 domain-containing protein [Acidobacteriota bacterium]
MEERLTQQPSSRQHPENPNIVRARELVLAHGWNSTSFQIVNPGIERWFAVAGDAVVGYAAAGGMRVVAGAPVCERERLLEVAVEFESSAHNANQRVCYFCAEARLESVFAGSETHSKFLLGAQPTWDPKQWPATVAGHRSFRAQLNRARNKRVTVSEWPVERSREHPALQECLDDWLDSKGLPPLHFMVESDTLSRLEGRRVFVAERLDEVIGFLVLSPVAQRNGWLFEQFPHRPGAPNGTVELMIDTAMRQIGADGSDYATLGLSPLSTRANVEPFHNPIWLRMLLTWFRQHGKRFYNFDGLDSFKAKLRPQNWEPVFALCNEPRVSFRTLYAIAAAFSGISTSRMVLRGLGRAVATEFRTLRARRKT